MFRKNPDIDEFPFEKLWQMLHADCKGKPVYEWLEVRETIAMTKMKLVLSCCSSFQVSWWLLLF